MFVTTYQFLVCKSLTGVCRIICNKELSIKLIKLVYYRKGARKGKWITKRGDLVVSLEVGHQFGAL